MINAKYTVRNLLINYAPLTALVPANSILADRPETITVFPIITIQTATMRLDADYKDNVPQSDIIETTVHVWQKPTGSTSVIATAIDDVMTLNLWGMERAIDLVEPDTKVQHKVLNYSRRIFK